MSDLTDGLAAAQRAYREGLRPLLSVPWRPGRSHEGNLWARTGGQADWKDDFPLGSVRTEELGGGDLRLAQRGARPGVAGEGRLRRHH